VVAAGRAPEDRAIARSRVAAKLSSAIDAIAIAQSFGFSKGSAAIAALIRLTSVSPGSR
jgi:hypothetical protein